MRLIKPSVELLEQGAGFNGIYEAIARAASTCYKSEPKFGDAAKVFVDTLIKNGHTAMLEFGTVYLTLPIRQYKYSYGNVTKLAPIKKYQNNPYSKVFIQAEEGKAYVTTNYRVILENKWEKDLDYMVLHPTKYHYKRYIAKFVISIGVGREFLRHRNFSFANESTRYCNYSKDRFNNDITFVLPYYETLSEEDAKVFALALYSGVKPNEDGEKRRPFYEHCMFAEAHYNKLISNGYSAQQAREVLPLCTKSELCMCGFEDDWRHFFDLRMRGTTGKPHPDAQYIAAEWWRLLKEKFGIAL